MSIIQDPDYTDDDPAYAADAFDHGITREEMGEVIQNGKNIPMKPSARGNNRAMIVGHASTRDFLIEVGVEIRRKVWEEDYTWIFHADKASVKSEAAFEARR